MKQRMFSFTVLISAVLCLWTGMAFGQPFPDKPMARLGKGTISDAAYSPDGKLLAVAGSLGVWLYDAQDLTEVGLLEGASQHIVISPNGEILASAHGEEIRLWDLQTQKQVGWLQGGDGPFLARDTLAISPNGKTLASPYRLWDLESQELVGSVEPSELDDGRPIPLLSVAFSPNGKNIVLGSDSGIWLWDVQTQKQVGRFQGSGSGAWFSSLAISPDGKTLASGEFDSIRLWDMGTLKQVGQLKAEEDSAFESLVISLAFSPDGKTLASAEHVGWDRFDREGKQTFRLWDVTSQQQIWQSQVSEAPVFLNRI